MSDLRFVTVRLGELDDKPIELVAATPKGTLRVIPLTPAEALSVIQDMAGYVRVLLGEEPRE